MTDKKKLTRRDFLTLAGMAGVSLPLAKVVGHVGGSDLLYSPEQYGGFLVKPRPAGEKPYEVDDAIYHRFDQKNEVFSRGQWDPIIQNAEAPFANVPVQRIMNNDKGFTQLDFAFYTAAWTVASTIGSDAGSVGGSNGGLFSWNPLGGFVGRAHLYDLPAWQTQDWTPEEVTSIVKTAAKFYGASMAGVAELDERWLYGERYTKSGTQTMGPMISAPIVIEDVAAPEERADGTLVIPRSMKYVIALAFEMDEDGIETVISGPASAAVGNGYSRDDLHGPHPGRVHPRFGLPRHPERKLHRHEHRVCCRRRLGRTGPPWPTDHPQVWPACTPGQGHHRYAAGPRPADQVRR